MSWVRLVYFFLALVSLVLPVWIVGTWVGIIPIPNHETEPNMRLWILVIVVPALSAGLLTLLGLRDARLNPRLSDGEKMKWRERMLFFGVFGVMVYFLKIKDRELQDRQRQEIE